MIDVSELALLRVKKALVTGIANRQSIAWVAPRLATRLVQISPSRIATTRQNASSSRQTLFAPN